MVRNIQLITIYIYFCYLFNLCGKCQSNIYSETEKVLKFQEIKADETVYSYQNNYIFPSQQSHMNTKLKLQFIDTRNHWEWKPKAETKQRSIDFNGKLNKYIS